MAAATPRSVAVLMTLLLTLARQSDDKNEGAKNVDDGEEGSHDVPAAAAPAGSDAGVTGESRRLIATDAAQADAARKKPLGGLLPFGGAAQKTGHPRGWCARHHQMAAVCGDGPHEPLDLLRWKRRLMLRPAEEAGHPRSSHVLAGVALLDGRPTGDRRAGMWAHALSEEGES